MYTIIHGDQKVRLKSKACFSFCIYVKIITFKYLAPVFHWHTTYFLYFFTQAHCIMRSTKNGPESPSDTVNKNKYYRINYYHNILPYKKRQKQGLTGDTELV